jgi:DNA-binding LytR/AlgR family response regulator
MSAVASGAYRERIHVRRRNDVIILPVRHIVSIVVEAELLHIRRMQGDRYTLTYRLHLLERPLDPSRFVRLSRGTLVNIDQISKVTPMAGLGAVVTLSNLNGVRGQPHPGSFAARSFTKRCDVSRGGS